MNEKEKVITANDPAAEKQTKPAKPKRTDAEKLRECYENKNKGQAKDKRIADLTDKVSAFNNFAERLNMLFAVFEDNANIGIVQKVASGLFGRK